MSGVWILVEGVDGSGKSELLRRLFASRVGGLSGAVVQTAEPTGSTYGKRAIECARAGRHKDALSLFVSDRHRHQKRVVWPMRREGACVLQDRGWMSTAVYQGMGLGHCEAIAHAHLGRDGWWPDLTLVLDVDAKTAAERIGARGEAAQGDLERADKLQARIDRYRHLAGVFEPDGVALVDASGTPEETLGAAMVHIARVCMSTGHSAAMVASLGRAS